MSVSLDPDRPSVPSLPWPEEPSRKLQALRRRLAYVDAELARIEARKAEGRGPSAASWFYEERDALEAAIECLAWVSTVWKERERLKQLRAWHPPKKLPG